MKKGTSLGDRMKLYESSFRTSLPINIPVILRLDGRAFHTFTRGMEKPFDKRLIEMLNTVALELCPEIQGTRLAYLQSDEISFLIYPGIFSDSWFKGTVQKMVSVAASHASCVAMKWCYENDLKKGTYVGFDARVFCLPEKDVENYFVWRQRDWERNSLQMFTRSFYTQRELKNKKTPDMHEMLHARGENWNDLATSLKRGRCVRRNEEGAWFVDNEIPIFTQDRDYITRFIDEVNLEE